MADPLVPAGFTGFLAKMFDGSVVREVNNRRDPVTGTLSATNWKSVPKSDINTLCLYWQGEKKASWSMGDDTFPEDWYFCHSAVLDMAKGSPVLVARSIGMRKGSMLSITRVDEATGAVSHELRRA